MNEVVAELEIVKKKQIIFKKQFNEQSLAYARKRLKYLKMGTT
jgi:hypothetical protein